MPRQKTAQLNIRSPYVRERVAEIAKQTGMTATEVIEDAIRGYVPPGGPDPLPPGMVRERPCPQRRSRHHPRGGERGA